MSENGHVVPVRCSCGSEPGVEVGSFGQTLSCGSCHASFVAVWTIDSESKKAVPTACAVSAQSTRGFNPPQGTEEVDCPCGQHLFARPEEAGHRVQCPVCTAWLKLEQSTDPETRQPRLRARKSRLNQLPEAPPQATPAPAPTPQPMLCSCGASVQVESAASGEPIRCTACGALLGPQIRQESDGAWVPIDPGTLDQAPPDEKRGFDEEWSLDDFK
jgi:DNA-directed RNA polymerase subunit N (RpoN/RPB10)